MTKPVTIKSFLPQREIGICQRVRELRLALKWNQPAFAAELGISRERIASYEYAKAPIRYSVGKRLCERFRVNPKWLAEGIEPKQWHIPIHSDLESQIEPGMLFSEAYDRFLRDPLNRFLKKSSPLKQAGFDVHLIAPLGAPLHDNYVWQMSRWVKEVFEVSPPELAEEFYADIQRACGAFKEKHKAEIQRFQDRKRESNLSSKRKSALD